MASTYVILSKAMLLLSGVYSTFLGSAWPQSYRTQRDSLLFTYKVFEQMLELYGQLRKLEKRRTLRPAARSTAGRAAVYLLFLNMALR